MDGLRSAGNDCGFLLVPVTLTSASPHVPLSCSIKHELQRMRLLMTWLGTSRREAAFAESECHGGGRRSYTLPRSCVYIVVMTPGSHDRSGVEIQSKSSIYGESYVFVTRCFNPR